MTGAWIVGFGENPLNWILLNFNVLGPQKWKSGLIFCLLNHAKVICSTVLATVL